MENGMIPMDRQFYERVYEQVLKIPMGKVCTYGKIAELAGYPNASREVGLAMSRVQNGMKLPCHRVINKKGTLAPDYAFGGTARQKKLLQEEGVTFLDDGTVNMQRHLWPNETGFTQMTLF